MAVADGSGRQCGGLGRSEGHFRPASPSARLRRWPPLAVSDCRGPSDQRQLAGAARRKAEQGQRGSRAFPSNATSHAVRHGATGGRSRRLQEGGYCTRRAKVRLIYLYVRFKKILAFIFESGVDSGE